MQNHGAVALPHSCRGCRNWAGLRVAISGSTPGGAPAIPTVFADYNRLFEGQEALQKKLAGAEEWRINVVGVRLAPSGRRGNGGVASVSYERVVHLVDRNLPDVTTRHAASIIYEYQPKVLAREKDRIENPLGFVVTAYRSDPEIASSSSTSGSTASSRT